MALDHWTGKTADGEKAEYFYNQSDRCIAQNVAIRILVRATPVEHTVEFRV